MGKNNCRTDFREVAMTFRTLSAIAAIWLTTQWVPTALADAEPKSGTGQEPGAEDPKQNPREFLFEVVTKDGKPVPGAVVIPWGVITNFGTFILDEKRISSAKTDKKGIIRIVFPKNPAGFVVKGDDNTGRLLRDLDQGILSRVALKIEHPDHPIWSEYIPVQARTITLENSVTVQVRAHSIDNARFVRKNLYPVFRSTFFQDFDWTDDNGLLTIRRLDRSGVEAVRWLRVVHVPEDGPVLFSSIVDLKEQSGNPISLRLPLKPGVRVLGRLAENVPRPVKNGHLVGRIVAGEGRDAWNWCATAEIADDGSFVLGSLPADEHLQIVAICDGWVTTSPTKEEVADYVADYGFPDPNYRGPAATCVYSQLYHLNGAQIEPVLPMEPTSGCVVTVIDSAGEPIPDARVAFAPTQFWFNAGSQIVGSGFDYLAKVRAQLASGDRRANLDDFQWNQAYFVRTNRQGMATVANIPPGGRGEPNLARTLRFKISHDKFLAPGDPKDLNRRSAVEILPGESKSITAVMTPK